MKRTFPCFLTAALLAIRNSGPITSHDPFACVLHGLSDDCQSCAIDERRICRGHGVGAMHVPFVLKKLLEEGMEDIDRRPHIFDEVPGLLQSGAFLAHQVGHTQGRAAVVSSRAVHNACQTEMHVPCDDFTRFVKAVVKQRGRTILEGEVGVGEVS